MKKLIFILFLMPSILLAQSDCTKYLKIDEDKMTGRKSASSKTIIMVTDDGGKTGLGISFLKSTEVVIASIICVGAGQCIDERTTVNVLFTDDSKLEFKANNDFTCDATAVIYFGDGYHTDEYSQIKSKKIKALRVWTSKGYVQKDFTESNSNEFMEMLACFSEQVIK